MKKKSTYAISPVGSSIIVALLIASVVLGAPLAFQLGNQNSNSANALSNLVSPVGPASPLSLASSPTAQLTILERIPVGESPAGIAVDAATNRIYVANQFDDTVSVIDGKTSSVIATVPVGKDPTSVAVDVRTNTVYVVNSNASVIGALTNGTISVIDGVTNIVTDTIAVGKSPSGVAVDQSTDKIYVSDYDGVAVINGKDNSVINFVSALSCCVYMVDVAVNEATNMIYATSTESGWVVAINGTTDAIAAKIGVYAASRIAVDENTNTIYVGGACTNNCTIDAINGETDSIEATISPGSYSLLGIAVDPQRNLVYGVTHTTLAVVNGSSDLLLYSVPQQGGDSVAVDPVRDTIYVTNQEYNYVYVISYQSQAASTSSTATSVNTQASTTCVQSSTTASSSFTQASTSASASKARSSQ